MKRRGLRLARRIGSDLSLKSGIRDIESKCKKLSTPPGMHGASRSRISDYGRNLLAKQRFKYTYGLSEKEIRRYLKESDNLLQRCEERLDNVVYRAGFAVTRAEARQLVSHRAILVNQQVVDRPSYRVKPKDIISVREKSRVQVRVQAALKLASARPEIAWISEGTHPMEYIFDRIPERNELSSEFQEKQVTEFYSK